MSYVRLGLISWRYRCWMCKRGSTCDLFMLTRQRTKAKVIRKCSEKTKPCSFSNELFWICCQNKIARMPNDDATTTKSGTTLVLNMHSLTCQRVALSTILNSLGKLWTTTFFRKYWHGLMPQRLELSRYQYLSGEFSSLPITWVKGERPFVGAILPPTNNL